MYVLLILHYFAAADIYMHAARCLQVIEIAQQFDHACMHACMHVYIFVVSVCAYRPWNSDAQIRRLYGSSTINL